MASPDDCEPGYEELIAASEEAAQEAAEANDVAIEQVVEDGGKVATVVIWDSATAARLDSPVHTEAPVKERKPTGKKRCQKTRATPEARAASAERLFGAFDKHSNRRITSNDIYAVADEHGVDLTRAELTEMVRHWVCFVWLLCKTTPVSTHPDLPMDMVFRSSLLVNFSIRMQDSSGTATLSFADFERVCAEADP
jgi:hypothetical protein